MNYHEAHNYTDIPPVQRMYYDVGKTGGAITNPLKYKSINADGEVGEVEV
jgi:hypothetical protein